MSGRLSCMDTKLGAELCLVGSCLALTHPHLSPPASMHHQVVGLEHLAEQDPSSSITTSQQRYSAPHSPLLRFSLTSLVYITSAILLVSVSVCNWSTRDTKDCNKQRNVLCNYVW